MLSVLRAVWADTGRVPAAATLEEGVRHVQDVIAVHLQFPRCPPLQGQVDPDVEGVP